MVTKTVPCFRCQYSVSVQSQHDILNRQKGFSEIHEDPTGQTHWLIFTTITDSVQNTAAAAIWLLPLTIAHLLLPFFRPSYEPALQTTKLYHKVLTKEPCGTVIKAVKPLLIV